MSILKEGNIMQTDRGTNEHFGDEDEIQQERQEKEWQYQDGAYDYFKLEKKDHEKSR
jgi:hypothetical protein